MSTPRKSPLPARIDGDSTISMRAVLTIGGLLVGGIVGGVSGITMARADLGFLSKRVDVVEVDNGRQDEAIAATRAEVRANAQDAAVSAERWRGVMERLDEIRAQLAHIEANR